MCLNWFRRVILRTNAPPEAPNLDSAIGRQQLQVRYHLPRDARYPRQLTAAQRHALLELYSFFAFSDEQQHNDRVRSEDLDSVLEDEALDEGQIVAGEFGE